MKKIYKHLVIGGGIIGASLASKLAVTASMVGEKTSVCLLEQHGIASGTTSKSAGIIIKDHKTDIATELASRTLSDLNKFSNLNELDSFSRVGTYNPAKNITTVEDGYVDPYELTCCYIKQARKCGLTVFENYMVQRIDTLPTENKENLFLVNNDIYAKNIYNATGYWASQIANIGNKKELPVAYMRSHYWEFTPQKENLSDDFESNPILLLPGIYVKFQRNKFEVGIQEKESMVIQDPTTDSLPSENEAYPSLIDNFKVLKKYIPDFENATLRNYISGISTYTADGLPIIDVLGDKRAENGRFVTISGCNGYGVTWAGGISSMIAEKNYNLSDHLSSSRFSALTKSDIIKYAQDIRFRKVTK